MTGATGSFVRGETGAPLVLAVGIAVATGATATGPTGAPVRGDPDVGPGEGIHDPEAEVGKGVVVLRNEGTAIGLNVATGACDAMGDDEIGVGVVFETGDSLAGETLGRFFTQDSGASEERSQIVV